MSKIPHNATFASSRLGAARGARSTPQALAASGSGTSGSSAQASTPAEETVQFINAEVLDPPKQGKVTFMGPYVAQVGAMALEDARAFLQGAEQILLAALAKALAEMLGSDGGTGQTGGPGGTDVVTKPALDAAVAAAMASAANGKTAVGGAQGSNGDTGEGTAGGTGNGSSDGTDGTGNGGTNDRGASGAGDGGSGSSSGAGDTANGADGSDTGTDKGETGPKAQPPAHSGTGAPPPHGTGQTGSTGSCPPPACTPPVGSAGANSIQAIEGFMTSLTEFHKSIAETAVILQGDK
ncbi:MAG: hypothetical protein QNJ16_14470 [Rhodobacter sp.]|nr:hypothetical protein [Rhodobacter sp.]